MEPLQHLQVQPLKNWCGPAALRHAFLWLGRRVSVRRVADLAGTRVLDETDEHQLARAAHALGAKLRPIVAYSSAEVWVKLLELLDTPQPTPVLLCVGHYRHWVAAVRATGRHVWIVDSVGDWDGAPAVPLYQRHAWRPFLRRIPYGLPDEVKFHLYPLVESEREA